MAGCVIFTCIPYDGGHRETQHKDFQPPAPVWGPMPLWVFYCCKHSYTSDYWCQTQTRGDEQTPLLLLIWEGQRLLFRFFFFVFFPVFCGWRKPLSHVATNVQYKWYVIQMHAKCTTLHSLAFFIRKIIINKHLLLARSLAIEMLSSDSFVLH